MPNTTIHAAAEAYLEHLRRHEAIFAERDRKLETSREARRLRRQAARKEAGQSATVGAEIACIAQTVPA